MVHSLDGSFGWSPSQLQHFIADTAVKQPQMNGQSVCVGAVCLVCCLVGRVGRLFVFDVWLLLAGKYVCNLYGW